MTLKEILDLPEWRPAAPAPVATAAGTAICGDLRNSEDRDPFLYFLQAQNVLYKYHIKNDEWMQTLNAGLANAVGAGSDAIFHPGAGPSGLLAAGATTTSVVISTALPAAVGVNQLANRGDLRGYKIRIIGKSAGGSGKTEERLIVGNTSGTTPTIYLDSALSFTPAANDGYEILSGKVFLLGSGALGAASFRGIDVATNFIASLSSTNLAGTIGTDSHMVVSAEAHVPYNRKPGEGILVGAGTYNGGLLSCLTATAAGASSLTGEAAAGDYNIAANEYRNFQIRIVEDTGTPTAVGQRRNITSHTGPGASPVYTVAAWTVQPSNNAKYVLEYNNDRILLFTTANTNVYNYSISGNSWDASTTWNTRGGSMGAGCCGQFLFGIPRDALGNARHSYLVSIRGNTQNIIDIFDISGAAQGVWSNDIVYGGKNANVTFGTGTTDAYDNSLNNGKYLYINKDGSQRNYRFDMVNRVLEPYGYLDYPMGTAAVGRRMAIIKMFDGATVYPFVVLQRMAAAEMFQNLIFR